MRLQVAGVLATHDLVDEGSIGRQVLEVDRAAHQQRIADRALQVPVRTLDRTVLVRDAAVIAGRLHAVMPAQRIVAARQILARLAVKIAERRR